MKNCWHSEVDFQLRSNLVAISPSPLSTPGFTIIESVRSEAIDAARLTYFGVSIFWRASVHNWVLMRRHPKRLELGPYEEPLRLFLLELASFPSDALMIISVTSARWWLLMCVTTPERNDAAEEAVASDNLFSATFGRPTQFIGPRRAKVGVRLKLGR